MVNQRARMLVLPSLLLLLIGPTAANADGWNGAKRVCQQGDAFWLVRAGQNVCRIANLVQGQESVVVKTAIGQLNNYVGGNHGKQIPCAATTQRDFGGTWIIAAAGKPPDLLATAGFAEEDVGDQGFVLRQIKTNNGTWLVIWGRTPLGCRYGIIEVLRSLEGQGNNCFTKVRHVVDAPRFAVRTYYNNFGDHLQNAFNVNMLYDVPVGRWSRSDWRQYLEMIAAMRYTTYEFWISPSCCCPEALKEEKNSPFERYAETMRWVIDQAHELGLKVQPIMCVNCEERTWKEFCPHVPEEHRMILAYWDHWVRKLSNADSFDIFPGDIGGCRKNGCTSETFIDLTLEIIAKVNHHGQFTWVINSWGPPFWNWGILPRKGTPEKARRDFEYVQKRLHEYPAGTMFAVERSLGAGGSSREYVERLRKSISVVTWEYYLSESEGGVAPIYRVPQILASRREEARWGYAGGLNYTMTPRLNFLQPFAAAEALWNPDLSVDEILARYDDCIFGQPQIAKNVFPRIDSFTADWPTNRRNVDIAMNTLKRVRPPKISKVPPVPSTNEYVDTLLWYTDMYQRLIKAAITADEIRKITGKPKMEDVQAWLHLTENGPAKNRVNVLLAEVEQIKPLTIRANYRSRVYGIYDMARSLDETKQLKPSEWCFTWPDWCCQEFLRRFNMDFFTPKGSERPSLPIPTATDQVE
jgi:hypothetical protein